MAQCGDAGDRVGREDFETEKLGVFANLVGKLSASNSLWKPGVVIDSLGHSGLTSDTAAFDDEGSDPFTSRIHGRSQTGRAAADHDEVVEWPRRLRIDSSSNTIVGMICLPCLTCWPYRRPASS
mgnify:CR=1 FL=1